MRTLDLIEYVVARPGGAAAHEMATALAIPVSSLSYLLATLVERGYLERAGRSYHAGPGLDRLHGLQKERSFPHLARPHIRALRAKLNETSSLFLPVGWEVEAVVTETAEQTLRYSIDTGRRTPLHCMSAGKAILAALPAEELDRYFAESRRERLTERTVVGRAALLDDIAVIRREGVARTRDEYTVGIAGVGAVVSVGGRPIAAVSVAVPTSRFSTELDRAVVKHMQATCVALEEVYRACLPVAAG